jgi:hypothetical protein
VIRGRCCNFSTGPGGRATFEYSSATSNCHLPGNLSDSTGLCQRYVRTDVSAYPRRSLFDLALSSDSDLAVANKTYRGFSVRLPLVLFRLERKVFDEMELQSECVCSLSVSLFFTRLSTSPRVKASVYRDSSCMHLSSLCRAALMSLTAKKLATHLTAPH